MPGAGVRQGHRRAMSSQESNNPKHKKQSGSSDYHKGYVEGGHCL